MSGLILPRRFRQKQGGFILNPFAYGTGGGGGPDPYFANVILLAHFNGANGGTTFTDEKGKTLTPTSTVQTSTLQNKFGSSVLRFPNSSGSYLTTPGHADFNFGTDDFCMEMWILTGHAGSYPGLLVREWVSAPWSGGWSWLLNGNSGSPMQVWFADHSVSAPLLTATNTGYRDGSWHHLAVVRHGNVFTLYIDGVANVSATSSFSIATTTKNVTIGADNTFGLRFYAGYMDDLRITRGVPRYTANFTPPAFQFPDS